MGKKREPRKTANRMRFWRSPLLPGILFMDGSCRDVVFSRHSHDTYAFGVVEEGALGFRYRGRDFVATPGTVNLAVPGEIHDGRGASGEGWRYRMAYVDVAEMLRVTTGLREGEGPPFIAPGVLADAELARFFRGFHESLRTGGLDGLSASTAWTLFACHLLRRHGERTGERPSPLPSVGRVRSFLEENMDRNVSLEELASLVSASPWHLLRAFRRETGLPPHAYQIQLRIREAQRKLLAGTAPVQVAAEVGFADQSHLTRWFRRIVGTTPAAFLRDTGPARGTGPFPADDGPRTRSEGAPSPRRGVALEPSSEFAGEEG